MNQEKIYSSFLKLIENRFVWHVSVPEFGKRNENFVPKGFIAYTKEHGSEPNGNDKEMEAIIITSLVMSDARFRDQVLENIYFFEGFWLYANNLEFQECLRELKEGIGVSTQKYPSL